MGVSREDWNAQPMPSSRSLRYQRRLSATEVDGLVRGFKPRSMDDKWFFFVEDGVVHMHRSWTGEEIYSFRLDRLDDGNAEVSEVRVNNAYPVDADAKDTLDLLFEKILPQYYDE